VAISTGCYVNRESFAHLVLAVQLQIVLRPKRIFGFPVQVWLKSLGYIAQDLSGSQHAVRVETFSTVGDYVSPGRREIYTRFILPFITCDIW